MFSGSAVNRNSCPNHDSSLVAASSLRVFVQKAYQRGNTIPLSHTAHISRHLPCFGVGVTVGSGAAVDVDVGVAALVGENCGVAVDAGDAVGSVCGEARFAVGASVGTNGTGILCCPTGVEAVAYETPAETPITTAMITTTTATATRRSFFERSDE